MSDRVTWESCPRCGQAAAVGWSSSGGSRDDAETVVEFDCPAGCSAGLDEVRLALASPARPGPDLRRPGDVGPGEPRA